jgi:hypothetical protein
MELPASPLLSPSLTPSPPAASSLLLTLTKRLFPRYLNLHLQAFTTTAALKEWEKLHAGESLEEATVVKMYASRPPITKMDSSLNNLKNCE